MAMERTSTKSTGRENALPPLGPDVLFLSPASDGAMMLGIENLRYAVRKGKILLFNLGLRYTRRRTWAKGSIERYHNLFAGICLIMDERLLYTYRGCSRPSTGWVFLLQEVEDVDRPIVSQRCLAEAIFVQSLTEKEEFPSEMVRLGKVGERLVTSFPPVVVVIGHQTFEYGGWKKDIASRCANQLGAKVVPFPGLALSTGSTLVCITSQDRTMHALAHKLNSVKSRNNEKRCDPSCFHL